MPGGGDRGVRVPQTSSLLSRCGRLHFAGTRQLGAAQGVSDAGSCRAGAGQAARAWQPAREAISVRGRAARALQVVIASLSPPGSRNMIPAGLHALPCCCPDHFCSRNGPWPSQCLSTPSPIAAPKSPRPLAAGPKAACRDTSFPSARQRPPCTSCCNAPAQHPRRERCPLTCRGCQSRVPPLPICRGSFFIQAGQRQQELPREQLSSPRSIVCRGRCDSAPVCVNLLL